MVAKVTALSQINPQSILLKSPDNGFSGTKFKVNMDLNKGLIKFTPFANLYYDEGGKQCEIKYDYAGETFSLEDAAAQLELVKNSFPLYLIPE